MRPQRRAAGDVAAGELGDEQRAGPGVDAEVAVDRRRRRPPVSVRPRRSVGAGANVSASQPLALLTRIATGPELPLGLVEEPAGGAVGA